MGTRNGYECAPYTLLETHQDYQVRKYPTKKWATVVFEKQSEEGHNDMPLTKDWKQQPQNKSFMKLFGYISGTNQPGQKIAMTVPVSTKVTREGHQVEREEMGFYLPEKMQDETPEPNEEQEVRIVTRPEMVAYVREFGGFAKDGDWQTQKELLRKSLEGREDFEQIEFDHYFRQGYDAPFKFWNRKNEIFFVKKE